MSSVLITVGAGQVIDTSFQRIQSLKMAIFDSISMVEFLVHL